MDNNVNAENYKNLELVVGLPSYMHYKAISNKMHRYLNQCARVAGTDEQELIGIIGDIKEKSIEFSTFIEQQILQDVGHEALDIITTRPKISPKLNSTIRQMDKEDLYQATFAEMDNLRYQTGKNMGVLRHPAPLKKGQVSINGAEYLTELQKLFSSMEQLPNYFAPTEDIIDEADDCMIRM